MTFRNLDFTYEPEHTCHTELSVIHISVCACSIDGDSLETGKRIDFSQTLLFSALSLSELKKKKKTEEI